MIDLWTGIGIVVFVAIVIAWDVLHPGPTPPDCDSLTSNDERCQALRIRQAQARAFMRRNGIKSLLDGRKAWRHINPMAMEESPKVLTLRRKS